MAVTLSQTTATLYAGYTLQLIATDSLSGTITWSTSDGSSMTVVGGLVTCLIGKGNINITATSSAGGSAVCVVTGYGISIGKVGKMLGMSSTSLGVLCSSTRINKWSRWKPIRSSSMNRTLVTMRNADYGFTIPTMYIKYTSAHQSLYDYAISGVYDTDTPSSETYLRWVYNLPRGGASEPYCLGDFRGYQHGAKKMFNVDSIPTSIVVTPDAYGQHLWEINLKNPEQIIGGLNPEDLNYSDNTLHAGVMIIDYERDGFPIVILKANGSFLVSDQTVTVDITNISSGTYLVCLFLYQDELTNGIPQLNSPNEATLTPYQYKLITGIEEGIRICGIQNIYQFPLMFWIFGKPPGYAIYNELKSSDWYLFYKPSVNYPVQDYIYSVPDNEIIDVNLQWTAWNQSFWFNRLQTNINKNFVWHITIEMFFHETVMMSENNAGSWFSVCRWYDIDTTEVNLQMTSSTTGAIKFRLIGEWDTIETLGTCYLNPPEYPDTRIKTLSLDVTNYTSNAVPLHKVNITVTGHNQAFTDTSSDYVEVYSSNGDFQSTDNPPELHFGYNNDVSSPKGVTFKYIQVYASSMI